MSQYADILDLGLIEVDSERRITVFNSWIRNVSRVTDDPMGRSLEEVFGCEVESYLVKAIGLALKSGMATRLSQALHPYPLPLRKGSNPDGDRLYQAIDVIPFKGNDLTRHCLIQVRDVSEMVKRESLLRSQAIQLAADLRKLEESQAALKQRTEEAEAANEARNDFLSVVTHELRSPLHTILGYAELIRPALPAGLPQDRLATLENSGCHLIRIIDDILEFSRGTKGMASFNPVPVSLGKLIDRLESHGVLLAKARRNRFSVVRTGTLPDWVAADEQRLFQVVGNLIDNACKYTQRGDIVLTVSGSSGSSENQVVLSFSVEDTGPGIEPEALDKIFDPFWRLKKDQYQPGLGLGLSIARQIAHQMGGDIQASNRRGSGACFTVRIPLQIAVENHAIDPPAEVSTPAGDPAHACSILIVDDTAEHRELLAEMISQAGFEVIKASSGHEAYELWGKVCGDIDVVLVDQFMLDGDGWDLLKDVRSAGLKPAQKVVLLSASEQRSPRDFPAGYRFDAVLKKPVSQAILMQTLNDLFPRLDRPDTPGMANVATEPACHVLLASLPEESARHLLELLEGGRISAIEEYAQQLAGERPELNTICNEIGRLCAMVDLDGIRCLLEPAQA